MDDHCDDGLERMNDGNYDDFEDALDVSCDNTENENEAENDSSEDDGDFLV